MQLTNINPAQSDYQRMAALIRQRPTKRRGLTMSEFAKDIVIPLGPDKGSKFNMRKSPYMQRPMECLSPESIYQMILCMWPTQVGKTLFAMVALAYYAKEVPSESIYATATLKNARKIAERRIEPIYRNVGLVTRTSTENRKSRRTGDTTFSKEFDGGNLDIATVNSTSDLASETKRFGIGDEIGQWPGEIGDQGSPWGQLITRLKAWKKEKKALGISSPTDIDSCKMYNLFLTGTQEEWEVPCPFCGKYQQLKIKHQSGYGLTWKTKNGRIVESSIVYECKKCNKSFKEALNPDIQPNGIWTQYGEPANEYTVSFHLTALNSQFESWYQVAENYELGLDDPVKMKEFTNFTMGLPWREAGARPKAENVMMQKGTYKSETVPMGVLFLTMYVDVQRGADRYRMMDEQELSEEIAKAGTDSEEKNFPRLEFEVLGIGPGHRTWSITYRRFLGKVDNAYSGAWNLLNDWANEIIANNSGFGFVRHDGMFFPISLVFIDSGYNTETVYQFCEGWNNCFPSKGVNELKKRKGDKGDELTLSNFMRYKIGRSGDTLFYNISTNYYKGQVYAALKVNRTDEDIQPPGFYDFPRDYNADYFKMLTAEERRNDGSYHAGGRRNEALDTKVGCVCAGDVWLTMLVERYREAATTDGGVKAAGVLYRKLSKEMSKIKINRRTVIDDLCIKAELPAGYYK